MKELQPLPEPVNRRNEAYPDMLLDLSGDVFEQGKKLQEIIPLIVLLLQEREINEHIAKGD